MVGDSVGATNPGTQMDKSARLSALIGDLYDASLNPLLWPGVLGEARDFVGGSAAGIVTKDVTANRGAVYYDDGGFAPEYTEIYFDRYVGLDPFSIGHFFSTVENPISAADLMPHSAFIETRLYNEWAKPQGFVDCIGTALDKSGTTATVFNVMRRKHDGLIDDQVRNRMRTIAPHVQRAVLIGQAVELKTAQTESLADALDGLSAGVFLISGRGQIAHANVAGRTMLAEGDPLISMGGHLASRNAEINRLLGQLFAAAEDGDVAISDQSIGVALTARDGREYAVHVLSLASGARKHVGCSHSATAAIFVHKAILDVVSPPAAIARRYRLTPTELRVLLAIVEVGGVPEVAHTLGVSDTTIKTHLGHLFEKTGAARQADLVKLFAGFASPLRIAPAPSA
jgi:DNA-binding CsgD family transcriptional regulator